MTGAANVPVRVARMLGSVRIPIEAGIIAACPRRFQEQVMAARLYVVGALFTLAFSGCGSNATGSSSPPADNATPRSYAAAQPVFELQSYLNYKCLDIKGANTSNGAQVIMWDCHGNANQRWYWDGDRIRSVLNHKCLDIKGANPGNGAQVIMWTCHGDANQRWYWDGEQIRSLLNHKCLDIKGANPADGAQVIMWDCHGGDNQRWYQWWY